MIMRKLLFLIFIFTIPVANAQLSRLYDNGVALFKQGDYKGTKIIMTRVINKSEYYFEAYTYRAMAYEQLGMPDSAKADFEKALEIKPGYLPAIFYRGVMYFNLKDYDKAIADFTTVLSKRPKYVKAILYRGRAYEATGRRDNAIADYSSAIKMNLKSYEIYYRRGLLFEKKNMPKDAIWDYDDAIALNDRFAPAYFHRGKMYQIREKDSLALSDFNKVTELTDTIKEVYELRGDLNFKLGNYNAAAEDYSVIINKYRVRDGNLYYKRAEAYYLDSNYSQAYKEYSRVLKVKPRYDKAVVGQAKVYMARGKPASALPLLRKALAFNPNNGEAYYLRGLIFFEQKKYEEAKADFDQSIKYEPRPAAYFYRGSCKYESGDKYGACLDLQQAVKMGYEENNVKEAVKRVCR
jgi:tetratricopeptide (TPR) repeat protein